MKRKMILLFTTAIIAVIALATAGITLALTTDETPSRGSITTAALELSAKAQNLRVYSATPAEDGDTDVFYDSDDSQTRKAYKYLESVLSGDELGVIKFANHSGGASLTDKSVTITGFLPGDKITFDIAVSADSTISFFYRTELGVKTETENDEDLFKSLEFAASNGLGVKDGLCVRKAELENSESEENDFAVLTDYTLAEKVAGNVTDVETVNITVSFPMTAQKGQGGTVTFYYVVSAVQDESESPIVAEYTFGGETIKFEKLSDAVKSAAENGVDTIRIVGNTRLEEGEVNLTLSDYVKFVGVEDEEGNLPILNGARIAVSDGSAASFENIRFMGDGYIDVSDAGALTVKNCVVATVPVSRNFDARTNEFLTETAFVVSGSSLTPVRLTLDGNTFTQSGSAAVYLNSRITDGTAITGNVFGTADKPYKSTVIALYGAEEREIGNGTAVVNISSNTVYGTTAFSFGNGKNGKYDVYSSANTVIGDSFARGIGEVALLDNGSLFGGEALTLDAIDASGLTFAGINVSMSGGHVVAGSFSLSDSCAFDSLFFEYIGVALENNSVFAIKDGKNHVINSIDGNDYTVEEI